MTQSKFKQLENWFHSIISDIKKDVKSELIKSDYKLYQKLFGKTYVAKLSSKELATIVFGEIAAENPALEEWIASRWVCKHPDIYQFFSQSLSAINPNFEEIKEIERERASKIVHEAVQRFGAVKTYLFSSLNSVAFDETTMQHLAMQAESERR